MADPLPRTGGTLSRLARYRGCLLGGAVGDALGAPVEFLSLAQIRSRYGPDGIQDFAEAYGVVGALTDDTQMTLFTAEGLLDAADRQRTRGIAHAPTHVHRAYLRWLHTQGEPGAGDPVAEGLLTRGLVLVPALHERRAPGITCLAALASGEAGRVDAPLNGSKGCGGVMRAAPVGLAVRGRRAFRLGCDTAALTHGHPSGYLAAGALALAVAALVEGATLDHALDQAESALEHEPDGDECLEALRAARALAASETPPDEAIETLGEGWIAEEALAIAAFAALRAGGDVARGVRIAVNHDGDSDSTGAIAGNLLGALLGEEAIPGRWRKGVELSGVLLGLADRLYKAFG